MKWTEVASTDYTIGGSISYFLHSQPCGSHSWWDQLMGPTSCECEEIYTPIGFIFPYNRAIWHSMIFFGWKREVFFRKYMTFNDWWKKLSWLAQGLIFWVRNYIALHSVSMCGSHCEGKVQNKHYYLCPGQS